MMDFLVISFDWRHTILIKIEQLLLDFIFIIERIRCVLRLVRTDTGSENVLIHDIQKAFRYDDNGSMSGINSYMTGISTTNQRIEFNESGRFYCILEKLSQRHVRPLLASHSRPCAFGMTQSMFPSNFTTPFEVLTDEIQALSLCYRNILIPQTLQKCKFEFMQLWYYSLNSFFRFFFFIY